jgi:hypothetical protein
MTWQCKLPLGLAILALVAGCASSPPPPLPPPQPLSPPPLSADELHKLQQHAYWSGYAAGRRYQKQQDAKATPDTPGAPTPATLDQAPPPAPVPPAPPPAESYSAKGPAKPVATPLN